MTNPQSDLFDQLTPDLAMQFIEKGGCEVTGYCFALNSYENRVFELELANKERVVAKFYRPRRWSREAILEEHRFLQELDTEEVPVAAPIELVSGQTLFEVNGIFCAAFKKIPGRAPEEFNREAWLRIGRLIGRLHNVGERARSLHRKQLTVDAFGWESLSFLREQRWIPDTVEKHYVTLCEAIFVQAEALLKPVKKLRLHGDCHRSNILDNRHNYVLVDFDDMVVGPAVQDLWLLNPGREAECIAERELLLQGYEEMREFNFSELRLIEPLRALRIVHYSAWIARRYHDPLFKRVFDQFREMRYWEEELNQLREIYARMQDSSGYSMFS